MSNVACFKQGGGSLRNYLLDLIVMKPFAEKFYKSKAWKKCRDSYFKSQHGICERCGGAGLIVHHTEYLTPDNIFDPEVSLNHDKLELLCQT